MNHRVKFILRLLALILAIFVWPLIAMYHSGPASPQQQPSEQQMPK